MKYTIKKGKHYANFTIDRLFPFVKLPLVCKVKFSKECWYSRDKVEYTGFNKLLGVSSLNIHNKSARFVWQPDFNNEGVIRLHAYVYPGSPHWNELYICDINVDEEFTVELSYLEEGWIFKVYVDDKKHQTSKVYTKHMLGIKPKGIFGHLFKAFPYFGGKSVAPNKMNIYINETEF